MRVCGNAGKLPIVISSKRIFSILLAATVALAVTPTAIAENGTSVAPKIGVVDTKEVFDNYDKQKVEYEALHKKRDEAQKPIDELSEQITKDRERYAAEADKMDDDVRRALEEKIQAAETRYKAEYDRAQEDINRQENKLLRGVLEDIHLAIQEVGAKYNYHLIFESAPDNASSLARRTGGLLYSSTTVNMTQRVIDHLNEQH